MQLPAPPRQPGTMGRPRKHGGELALADPATWPAPQVTTSTVTSRYGTAAAAAWDRVHPRLTHRVRLARSRRPAAGHRGNPDPAAGRSPARRPRPQARVAVVVTDRRAACMTWTGCGRRSCAVSTWSTPSGCSSRSSAGPPRRSATRPAADRWTWLIITCHAQLRLARPLAADLRLPWERPAPPGRLTPARVRRGFRNIRATAAQPAGAPKPGKPGPGRPPGSKNRRPAPRHDVGKTTKRELTLKARRERAG